MKEININTKNYDYKQHQNDVEKALQELKKALKKEGLFQELYKRTSYTPPSKKKRDKKNNSIKQRKRDERTAEWHKKHNNNDF